MARCLLSIGIVGARIDTRPDTGDFLLAQPHANGALRPGALHIAGARTAVLATTVAAVGFVLLFAYVAVSRMAFPFDLEWGEGLFVDHVARILHRQQLYVRPSITFTPLVYTPGYYYAAAAAAKVFGLGITTLRGVSLVCSLLLLCVLAAFGRREFGTTREGLVLAGLFAACYTIGGAWLDIARSDALLLLLVFSAAYLARHGESMASLIATGLLLTAAVLTKQVALTLAPPLLVYMFIRHGWRGLASAATWLISLLVMVGLLQGTSKGWFLYYTFTVLSRAQTAWLDHPFVFWTSDLFGRFPVGTALGLLWCAVGWRLSSWRDWAFYGVFGAGLLVSTWEARVHPGAWFNTLLPAYAFLSIAALRMAREIDRRVAGAGSLAIAVQLALLLYNPAKYIPAQSEWNAAMELADTIARVPGDVLFFDHAQWSARGRKRSYVHEMAMRDVLAAHDQWGDSLVAQIREAVSSEQFDVVILDSTGWFPLRLGRYYKPVATVATPRDLLKQRVGNPIYPATIFVPQVRHVDWPPRAPMEGAR